MNHFCAGSTRDRILTFFLAAWFVGFSAFAQELKQQDLRQAGNLQLLNLWGEQPAVIQSFYQAAFDVLEAYPFAGYAALSQDSAVRRLGKACSLTHLGGPMLGDVTSQGAKVWVRTLYPARVEIRVAADHGEKKFGPVKSTVENDLSAVVEVTGLKPATSYGYRVLIDGTPIHLPQPAFLTTLPASRHSGPWRIIFGSCYHRWGLGNQTLAQRMAERKPHALLLCGDIAAQDRNDHLGLHRADYLLRDFFPAWKNLVASLPVYAVWDDHDYFDNDKAGIPEGFSHTDRVNVWRVFKRAWNNPSYGFGSKGEGVFFRTRIGPCDVIMTDTRYFRKNEPGSFLGDEQMNWLLNQLQECEGPFIILSGGTMWSDYVSNGKDSWGRWDPAGRERIFRFIESKGIGGVLLISGDRHGARGFRIPRSSGYEFYEFEAASLGGRTGPPATDPEWRTQLYGVAGVYAFGEFTFDASPSDPIVTFRLIQQDGTILYEVALRRSRLTPPPSG